MPGRRCGTREAAQGKRHKVAAQGKRHKIPGPPSSLYILKGPLYNNSLKKQRYLTNIRTIKRRGWGLGGGEQTDDEEEDEEVKEEEAKK